MRSDKPQQRPRAVWTVRHGQRIDMVDPAWREGGGDDPWLSPGGVEQARKTGQRLKGEGIRHIFASPFLRAVETAHHIGEALDLDVRVEHGLGEWLNPEWFREKPALMSTGMMADRFLRVDRNYEPAVIQDYPETWEHVLARTARTVEALLERFTGDILLVGHGASVAGVRHALTGSHDQACCDCCALFKMARRNEEWFPEIEGDTSHLGQTPANSGMDLA